MANMTIFNHIRHFSLKKVEYDFLREFAKLLIYLKAYLEVSIKEKVND